MSCSAICVYLLAFWASILHRVYGSAAFLTQFHSHICGICGKHIDNSEIGNRQSSRILLLTFFNKVVMRDGLVPTAIFIMHICLAVFEVPKPLRHFPLTHYTWPIIITKLLMNLGCSKICCIQKSYHCMGFTTHGIFDKLFT